jgi:hypothetical protein
VQERYTVAVSRISHRLFSMVKHFSSVVAVFTACLSASHSAVYYVDSVGGNDSNSGLSPGTAWATLGKVDSTTFLPGDSLLLKRGCAWSGKLAPSGSGYKANPIVIDTYGTGPLPVVSGGGLVDNTVEFNNQNDWTIRNLEITNTSTTYKVRSGVLIQAINAPASGFTLQGLYVHNVDGISAWGNDKWTNAAIRFNQWQDSTHDQAEPLSDMLVEGCRIEDVHEIAILMLSNSSVKNPNIVCQSNFINRTGADGIVLENCEKPSMIGNTCLHAGALSEDFEYIAAIWTFDSDSPLFERNEVGQTAVQYNDGKAFPGDSVAFDVDSGCTGTPLIEHNYSHDNGGGFLLVMPNSNFDAVVARFNICINDARTNCAGNCSFHLGRGQVYFYNNVFFDSNKVGIVPPDEADTFYVNNIFCSNGPSNYGTKPTYSHNCYYGPSPTVNDADKLLADPQFVKPGTAGDGFSACVDYRLKKLSPCRGKGVNVPDDGATDFFGRTLSLPSSDIGAQRL